MSTLQIYDTTLRDGAQGVGINFSVSDKLRIAAQLDQLGVSVIEGGWPGSNATDTVFFAQMRGHEFTHAVLAAFGATRRAHVRAEDDPQLRALFEAGTPIVTRVGRAAHHRPGEPADDLRLGALAHRAGSARGL